MSIFVREIEADHPLTILFATSFALPVGLPNSRNLELDTVESHAVCAM